ncbi:hypothetical protein LTR85_001523 [Meristemomyces frigidus]|nr:hypothetical protein LTR85_001523 [Meristemomyces frigidus]
MGQIYKQASTVIVWLGESEEPHIDASHRFSKRPAPCGYKKTLWQTEDHQIRSVLSAIELTRPRWWERAWVIQEVVIHPLPPRIAFGPYIISWDTLKLLLHTLQTSYPDSIPKDFFAHMEYIEQLKVAHREERLSLIDVVANTPNAGAADERDRVYSLLSLIPLSMSQSIIVDYGRPLKEIFTHATYASLVSSDTLDILHYVRLPSSPHAHEAALETYRSQAGRTNTYFHPELKGVTSWMIDFSSEFALWPFKRPTDVRSIPHLLSPRNAKILSRTYNGAPNWRCTRWGLLHQSLALLRPGSGHLVCHGRWVDVVRAVASQGRYGGARGDAVSLHAEKAGADLIADLSIALEEGRLVSGGFVKSLHQAREIRPWFLRPDAQPRAPMASGDVLMGFPKRRKSAKIRILGRYAEDGPPTYEPGGPQQQEQVPLSRDKETWIRRLYYTGQADLLAKELLASGYISSDSTELEPTDRLLSRLLSRWHAGAPGFHDGINVRTWLEYFRYTTGFSQLFCTDLGLMGLAAGAVEVGDAVVFLNGSQHPVILKPESRYDQHDEVRFRFREFAYVSGPKTHIDEDELDAEREFVLE